MQRPYMALSAEALFERGLEALRQGERAAYDECRAELQGRRSRLAQELAEELADEARDLASESPRTGGTAIAIDAAALCDPMILTDAAIVEHRRRMLEAVTASVWLSTYTYKDPDDTLTRQLTAIARKNLAVRVFVSVGRTKTETVQRQLRALQRAGVEIYANASTHSKCVVVDDEHVLIGSANLNTTHRDLSLYARSASLGAEIKRYLMEVGGERT